MELGKHDKVHFIGIGGVSMSGLAHALADRGYQVSGSDRSDSERLNQLRQAGITCYVGHAAGNVAAADVVIYTTAIREDNPERQAAVLQGKRLYHRSEMLAWMLQGKQALAVAGTHGKTTTSAMLAWILQQAGLDPLAFIGGDVNNWHSNYRLGNGPHIVLEACESDASFLQYKNCREIITNIEPDHLDQHATLEHLKAAFAQFLSLADPEGFVVWGSDCPELPALISQSPARTISFGLMGKPDYAATDLRLQGYETTFELLQSGESAGLFNLLIPGQHNVLNALAAIAAAEASGVSLEICREALGGFKGTGRRFELLGRLEDIAVYDDYAHHPTEVRATLAAARTFGAQRIIAIFQPHLYSRTRDFMNDFAAAFSDADIVFINSIYAAREDPMPGVSAEELARRIHLNDPGKEVSYVPSQDNIVEQVRAIARPGDLILTIGAGDIRQAGEKLAADLAAH